MARPSRRAVVGPLTFSFILLSLLGLLLVLPPLQRPGADLPRYGDVAEEPEIRVLLESLAPGRTLTLGRIGWIETGDGRRRWNASKPNALEVGARGVRLGGEPLALPARLSPAAEPLEVDRRSYEGHVDLIFEDGKALLINHVRLERYLESVVVAEMGHFSDAALEAQAVCSRAYAVFHMRRRARRSWDVRDDQRSQVYRGIPAARSAGPRTVAATRGQILVHDGKVLEALFTSTCGGATRAAGEAFGGETARPLGGVPCGLCGSSPFATWKTEAPAGTIARSLGLSASFAVEKLERSSSGRLSEVVVSSSGRHRTLPASRVRRAFQSKGRWRSSWITELTVVDGRKVVVRGRGFGHGVGLCQYGAESLAHAGHDYRAILERYYPGARLVRLYDDE